MQNKSVLIEKIRKATMTFFSGIGIQVETSTYDPKFVAKIKRSEKQAEEGKVQRLDPNDLWK